MSCEGLSGTDLQLCEAAGATGLAAVTIRAAAFGPGTLDSIAGLLEALSGFLLPLAALILILKLWPVFAGIFESRKFTIKIAGFELSAQEATDQLRTQIEDLQAKVAALEAGRTSPAAVEALKGDDAASLGDAPEPPRAAPAGPPRRILWVDDNPSNNAALIAGFQNEGIEVETAVSGQAALARLSAEAERFAAVITDQGRIEDGRYVSDAGTALVREMRAGNIPVPVAVFTSQRGVRMGGAALGEGAEIVTSSGLDIRRFVERHVGAGT